MLCIVNYNATNNEISELVQSVCIEIDDLTANEIAHVLNVFMKYFDFEGQKTAGRLEYDFVISNNKENKWGLYSISFQSYSRCVHQQR